jgi:hypothetical protein
MKPGTAIFLFFSLAAMGSHRASQAATFCVSTEAALHAALTTAASNGQHDLIKLVEGTYRSSSGGFSYVSSQPHDLSLVGGWEVGCFLRTGSLSTMSDDSQGSGARVLDIDAGDSAVIVDSLRIVSGNPPNLTRGGGLRVQTGAGDITIDRSFFGSNTAASNGAVYARADHGDIRARNNLIAFNNQLSGAALALVALDGNIYATGNTVYGNSSSVDDDVSAGLSVSVNAADASKRAYIVNNMLRNYDSGNPDFEAFGAHYRYHNAIFTLLTAGDPPIEVVNDTLADPGLCLFGPSCGGTYAPLNDSPLLNAGVNIPFGGALSLDVYGNPRIVGTMVDIGAVENIDACFASGFE